MTADLLRQAAALMRERAEAATPGPWISTVWPRAIPGVYSQAVEDVGKCDPEIARTLDEPDATHVASWHPAVALAVADWLDVTATDLDANSILDRPESDEGQLPNPEALWCDKCGRAIESPDYTGPENECECYRAALAVARAYLGTPT